MTNLDTKQNVCIWQEGHHSNHLRKNMRHDILCTLSLKSICGHSSVCYKTTQNTGGVGRTGTAPPTSKLGTYLSWPLPLSMLIYSNFQINGISGETLKSPTPLFCFKNWGSGGFIVSQAASVRPTPPESRVVL